MRLTIRAAGVFCLLQESEVGSSAEHLGDDEYDEGAEKASASEEIDQGITCGGKQGMYH